MLDPGQVSKGQSMWGLEGWGPPQGVHWLQSLRINLRLWDSTPSGAKATPANDADARLPCPLCPCSSSFVTGFQGEAMSSPHSRLQGGPERRAVSTPSTQVLWPGQVWNFGGRREAARVSSSRKASWISGYPDDVRSQPPGPRVYLRPSCVLLSHSPKPPLTTTFIPGVLFCLCSGPLANCLFLLHQQPAFTLPFPLPCQDWLPSETHHSNSPALHTSRQAHRPSHS